MPKSDPTYAGAVLFSQRCGGLPHDDARRHPGLRRPQRPRARGRTSTSASRACAQALFAIRNGGFSGSIMPQNIVTGRDADAVAAFVAKYAGTQEVSSPRPGETTTTP